MTSRQLRSACERYRRLLGMAEWSITVAFGDPARAAGVDDRFIVYGCTEPDPDTHVAIVTINRQAHTSDDAIRETLVHEPLHVCLDPASTLANDVVFEVGLNRLARVMAKTATRALPVD